MNKKGKNIKSYFMFCKELEFDHYLEEYKNELIDLKTLNNTIVFCNQFYIVNDFSNANIAFIHPNIERIAGYKSENFVSYDQILDLIHPEDKEVVLEFTKRSVSICKFYKEDLLLNPFITLFSIDFRFRHQNGSYIKLNRQTTCYRTDRKGNVVFTFDLVTEITYRETRDHYNIKWLGDNKSHFHIEDIVQKYNNGIKLTFREKEILKFLSEGESATAIAKKLCLSTHTVISHRKHMLEKTGTKNTAELIKFAFEKGLI